MNKHIDIDATLNVKTGLVLIARWVFEEHQITYYDSKVYSIKKYPQLVKYFAGATLRQSGTITKQKTIFLD